MKKFIDFLFSLLCKIFICDYKHLDDAYQEVLPASPVLVRETLMYKRIKRFVKLALMFRNYELIMDLYRLLPSSVGRCVWNILRDETKYILFHKDKFNFNHSFVLENGVKCKFVELVLGKWSKDKFIELASIDVFEEEIEDDDEDENKSFEDIESFDEAAQYIQNVFTVPVSEMELNEEDEEQIIAKIIWLFDNARNDAVKAAIHKYALGDTYLDFEEEKEVLENIYYENIFCNYFSQSHYYVQLKHYDGTNKTLQYLTKIVTFIVDDAYEEHFFEDNCLEYNFE